MTGKPTPLPLNMTAEVERFTEAISDSLDTHCSNHNAGVTSPAKMSRIQKWLRENLDLELPIITREDNAKSEASSTALLVKLLKEGVPVILSKQRDTVNHHYMVATSLRQRSHTFRVCDEERGECSGWTFMTVSEVFVHQGLGERGLKWENADTHFVAAMLAD